MMIFTVHDVKVEAYTVPFFARTEEEAKRMFGDAVNLEGHNFQTHAEDYSLWKIGYWHEDEGKVESVVPMCLCKAMECVLRPGMEVGDLTNG